MTKRKSPNKNKKQPQPEPEQFVFRAQHFYELLENQAYRCALTGRELTPENTTAEHIIPLRTHGEHRYDNIYLVDEQVSKIKRYLTDEDVVELAAEIIETRGYEFGYALKRSRQRE
ncbi:MAG: hypothetical protein KDK39_19860 [Leptospiraceae bacterium]|nr:hypothetical protein [Leptospiraceae bacterium]